MSRADTKAPPESLLTDLHTLRQRVDRRTVLTWISAGIALPVAACAPSTGASDDPDTDTDTDTTGGSCEDGTAIPRETPGPYPGDGTNGPDVLAQSGIVRADLRPNLDGSDVAEGVELTVRLRIVSTASCAPLAGAAVYLWHCDREGLYSMYTKADATYLRGVQVADAEGYVSFTTIFPGCYPGRWPHMHFEVFATVDDIDDARTAVATSQLGFPQATCEAVYAEAGYAQSAVDLQGVSLMSDGVFRDGSDAQITVMSGSVGDSLTASLVVPVDA